MIPDSLTTDKLNCVLGRFLHFCFVVVVGVCLFVCLFLPGLGAEVEFGFTALPWKDLCYLHLEIYSRQLKNLEHRRGVLAGGENVGTVRIWKWHFKLQE